MLTFKIRYYRLAAGASNIPQLENKGADHSVAGPSVAGPSKSPILEHEAEDAPPPPPPPQQASARDPLRQPPELIAKVKQYFPREGYQGIQMETSIIGLVAKMLFF